MKKILLIYLMLLAVAGARADKATEIADLISGIFPSDRPGAVAMVAKGDSIILARGFGLAMLSPDAPVDTATLFNICSISK